MENWQNQLEKIREEAEKKIEPKVSWSSNLEDQLSHSVYQGLFDFTIPEITGITANRNSVWAKGYFGKKAAGILTRIDTTFKYVVNLPVVYNVPVIFFTRNDIENFILNFDPSSSLYPVAKIIKELVGEDTEDEILRDVISAKLTLASSSFTAFAKEDSDEFVIANILFPEEIITPKGRFVSSWGSFDEIAPMSVNNRDIISEISSRLVEVTGFTLVSR